MDHKEGDCVRPLCPLVSRQTLFIFSLCADSFCAPPHDTPPIHPPSHTHTQPSPSAAVLDRLGQTGGSGQQQREDQRSVLSTAPPAGWRRKTARRRRTGANVTLTSKQRGGQMDGWDRGGVTGHPVRSPSCWRAPSSLCCLQVRVRNR